MTSFFWKVTFQSPLVKCKCKNNWKIHVFKQYLNQQISATAISKCHLHFALSHLDHAEKIQCHCVLQTRHQAQKSRAQYCRRMHMDPELPETDPNMCGWTYAAVHIAWIYCFCYTNFSSGNHQCHGRFLYALVKGQLNKSLVWRTTWGPRKKNKTGRHS